jgi:putative serine protease PepD
MTRDKAKRKAGGVISALLYFGGVGVLVALILWASAGSDPLSEDAVAILTTTTTTIVENLDVEAPSYLVGEEPIADAAQVILPSVVHIQTDSGIGSGVIYDADGLIMTAAHVVEGSEQIRVRLPDGELVDGELVGLDSDVDIAVVKINRTDLLAAAFNLGKARVGQMAVAVGSPWDLEATVTAGIVSAVDQTNCQFESCVSMVQTDAAINPGNSGGPLVDRHGQVIGINVSIFTNSGENAGVGFAVPAATAMTYARSIVSGEILETAFLGISGEFAVEGQSGALIIEVFPDTAAAEAGIEVDDVIISLGGVEILGIDDLSAQIKTYRPGDTVEVVLIRDGETIMLDVTLRSRPDDLS